MLSAIGDIAIGDDGKPSLQVHIVLGLSNGLTRGVEASARALVPGVLVNVSWNLVSFCWELLRVRTVSS